MTCYKPLHAYRLKLPDGNSIVKVLPKNFKFEDSELPLPSWEEVFPIPCGRCIGCRLDYSRKWADRLLAELTCHDKACFITLTYSTENLPKRNEYTDPVTGEVLPSPRHPLNKEHVQLFMKRLRKKFGNGIRFYAVGEYGSEENTCRPHYHIILFGVDFADDRQFHFNKNGFAHWTSPTLYDYLPAEESNSLWKYGQCDIANVSWQSCAYVARYCTKKLKGDAAKAYEYYNYTPEFALMSRRPGIGSQFFEEHKDSYRTGLFIGTENGSIKLMPNSYFDSLYDVDYPARQIIWIIYII